MTNAAQLAAIVTIPRGGVIVLTNVKAGRSPWEGWEAGTMARTPEGQEAYEARARAITLCRERGLLTVEGVLTDEGERCLAAWESRLA